MVREDGLDVVGLVTISIIEDYTLSLSWNGELPHRLADLLHRYSRPVCSRRRTPMVNIHRLPFCHGVVVINRNIYRFLYLCEFSRAGVCAFCTCRTPAYGYRLARSHILSEGECSRTGDWSLRSVAYLIPCRCAVGISLHSYADGFGELATVWRHAHTGLIADSLNSLYISVYGVISSVHELETALITSRNLIVTFVAEYYQSVCWNLAST